LKINWKVPALIYLVLIPLCAGIYWAGGFCWEVPENTTLPISEFESLYISVVTITTLGYGDYIPLSDGMKLTTMIQALFGVLTLGAFLVGLAQELVDSQERKHKQISKANLLAQHDVWKEGVLEAMLTVSSRHNAKSPDNIALLCNPDEFRKFYGGGPNSEWLELVKGLEFSPRFVKIIQSETRQFGNEIRGFTNKVNVGDRKRLKKITEYITFLTRHSNYDFSNESEKSLFFREIWNLLGPENVMTRNSFYFETLLIDV